jgi:hypothetical protein
MGDGQLAGVKVAISAGSIGETEGLRRPDGRTARPFPATAMLPGSERRGPDNDLGNGRGNLSCLMTGTLVSTPSGEVPVEHLAEGDYVTTLDSGARRLRWIGAVTLSVDELAAHPGLRPVRIAPRALGPAMPVRELCVAQEQRVLLSGRRVEQGFGEAEVLVRTGLLVGEPGVRLAEASAPIRCFYLLLDRHEVIFANGLPVESLLVGDAVRHGQLPESLLELRASADELHGRSASPARRLVDGSDAALLTAQAA